MLKIEGIGVSTGVSMGKLMFPQSRIVEIDYCASENPTEEVTRFEQSRALAGKQLGELAVRTAQRLGKENSLLFEIHQMMLEDLDYCEGVINFINEEKVTAEYAVSEVAKLFAQTFASMDDEYMQARAVDVRDVSMRVIDILLGKDTSAKSGTEPCIYAGEDFTPSETVQFDREQVLGLATSEGSRNSHTAIFARTLGIPAVIGFGEGLSRDHEGKFAVLDGESGVLYIEPDEMTLKELTDKKEKLESATKALDVYRGRPSMTRTGQEIKVYANIGMPKDVESVLANDAEGIGLFRSEFLYLESADYPSEEVQFEAYRKVAEGMKDKSVIIRTLDIGADKQAAYFNLDHEENPAMGLRAIRICLTRPEIFRTQLRALYRASAYGNISIMLPMIISVDEVRQAKAMMEEVKHELRKEGFPFHNDVPVGIMIETPAAAIISDLLAKEVDFFSMGTNDLTQYTLAVDRQNPKIAPFCNTHHDAVLRLIELVCKNAHDAGIWAGICGDLGADLELTEFFARVGVDELSVSPTAVLPLREKICNLM